MVYLYAGLGVAMLAGIMAIFEMGLALSGRSLLPAPVDLYLSNDEVKAMDRKLLALLVDGEVSPGLLGSSLCAELISAYDNEHVPTGGVNPWLEDARMPLNTGDWAGSCVINDGAHQVVVMPDPGHQAMPYQFYSCVRQAGDDQCSFEQDG